MGGEGEALRVRQSERLSTEEGDNVEDEEPTEGDAGREEETLAAARFLRHFFVVQQRSGI
jgi:hypothetical protein